MNRVRLRCHLRLPGFHTEVSIIIDVSNPKTRVLSLKTLISILKTRVSRVKTRISSSENSILEV